MKVGTPCQGRITVSPNLYRSGRGVAGWRASKEEMRERKAFKRLPPREAAVIEGEKLQSLRETMESIFE